MQPRRGAVLWVVRTVQRGAGCACAVSCAGVRRGVQSGESASHHRHRKPYLSNFSYGALPGPEQSGSGSAQCPVRTQNYDKK